MDDGRVLQTQTYRPCFSPYFGITGLSIRVRLPLVLLPQINSPWNVNSWTLFTAQLPWTATGFFPLYLFIRGLEMATHWLQICWTFLILAFALSVAVLFSCSKDRGWILRFWFNVFSLWDRGILSALIAGRRSITFCPNSDDATLNANPSFSCVNSISNLNLNPHFSWHGKLFHGCSISTLQRALFQNAIPNRLWVYGRTHMDSPPVVCK